MECVVRESGERPSAIVVGSAMVCSVVRWPSYRRFGEKLIMSLPGGGGGGAGS